MRGDPIKIGSCIEVLRVGIGCRDEVDDGRPEVAPLFISLAATDKTERALLRIGRQFEYCRAPGNDSLGSSELHSSIGEPALSAEVQQ